MPLQKRLHAPLHAAVCLADLLPVIVIEPVIGTAEKFDLIRCRYLFFVHECKECIDLPRIQDPAVIILTCIVLPSIHQPVQPEISVSQAETLQNQRPFMKSGKAALQITAQLTVPLVTIEVQIPPLFYIRQNNVQLLLSQHILFSQLLCRLISLRNLLCSKSPVILHQLRCKLFIQLRISFLKLPHRISVELRGKQLLPGGIPRILFRIALEEPSEYVRRFLRHPPQNQAVLSPDRPADISLFFSLRQNRLQRLCMAFKPLFPHIPAAVQRDIGNPLSLQRHGKTHHSHEPVRMFHGQKCQKSQEAQQILRPLSSGQHRPDLRRDGLFRIRFPHKFLQPFQVLSFRPVLHLKETLDVSNQPLFQIFPHFPDTVRSILHSLFFRRHIQPAPGLLLRLYTVEIDRSQEHPCIYPILIVAECSHPKQGLRILSAHIHQKPELSFIQSRLVPGDIFCPESRRLHRGKEPRNGIEIPVVTVDRQHGAGRRPPDPCHKPDKSPCQRLIPFFYMSQKAVINLI